MRGFIIIICFFLASASFAANDNEALPGAVKSPGYDRFSLAYVNSLSDDGAVAMRDRFGALYAAQNPLIPSRVMLVSPSGPLSQLGPVDSGNIESAARAYLAAYGLIPSGMELGLISMRLSMGRVWFVSFAKTVDGVPLEGETIGLAISPAGRVNLLWGDIGTEYVEPADFPREPEMALSSALRGLTGDLGKTEYIGRVIFPLYFEGRKEYHPAHKFMVGTSDPYAEWEVIVDARSGEVLKRENKIYYDVISGDVTGLIQPMYPTDSWVTRNFFHLDLDFTGYGSMTTDMNGHYSYNTSNSDPLDVYANFRGPFMEVLNEAGDESEIIANIDPPAEYDIHWTDANSTPPERDAWYHGVFVHNWITTLDPTLAVMDFPMICNVNVYGSCNAFWSGWTRTINFYGAGGGCSNIAQIADVVYHEYGHGITDLQTRPLGPDGAMHEGFSDYIACTITDQPYVGRGFYTYNPNDYLRRLDNDLRYPEDWHGESHDDGRIIGGALWDLRTMLSPYPMGYTDSIWHFARYAQTDNFEDYFWALAAQDDDDGDISNGTPNALPIFRAFGDLHGIGPGSIVSVVSDSLYDCEDTTRTYAISAVVSSFFDLLPDSVILYYDNGTGYAPLAMTNDGARWNATIPAQRNNTQVNYYVLAVNRAGFRGTSPAGAPAAHYTFHVRPDMIPPTIALIQGPPNTVNLFGPYGPFLIDARDINGINPSQVWVHYRVNSESEHLVSLSLGVNPNEFTLASLNLFRQLSSYDTIHYYFNVMDGARNHNVGRLPSSGTFSFTMTTSETFETFETTGMDRWNAEDGWILRNDGYNSQHSIWYSSPNYPNNANSSISMNFGYDLSPYANARITLYRRNLIRAGDTCFVEASNNGGFNWHRVGALVGTVAPMYQPAEFDIGSVLNPGGHDYRIRFRFVSNEDSSWVGVFFDNIGWAVTPTTGLEESTTELPRDVSLAQNYPNPFNPETNISFGLPRTSNVRLEVFDILGRRVVMLLDDEMAAGNYRVTWDGTDESRAPVASGIYFYRLTTELGTRQEKMTLLR